MESGGATPLAEHGNVKNKNNLVEWKAYVISTYILSTYFPVGRPQYLGIKFEKFLCVAEGLT